jgi:hypothetical protein
VLSWIRQRVAGFEAQERKNPLLTAQFGDTFALEFAPAKVIEEIEIAPTVGSLVRVKRRDIAGVLAGCQRAMNIPAFTAFSFRLVGFTWRYPPEVRTPFEGRLRGAPTPFGD